MKFFSVIGTVLLNSVSSISSGHTPIQFATQLPLINVSYNVLEFISKYQIVLDKRAIFFVWTCIVTWIGKEYLSKFKSLNTKEKARPSSSMNINLLCAVF